MDLITLALCQNLAGSVDANLSSLASLVNENKKAITILNGDNNTEGSVKKQINDALSELIANAPESLDTLKEIADWISEEGADSVSLINRVKTIEEGIKDLEKTGSIPNEDIQVLF